MRRTRTLVDLSLAILVVYGLRGLIMWSVESEAIAFPVASAAESTSAGATAPSLASPERADAPAPAQTLSPAEPSQPAAVTETSANEADEEVDEEADEDAEKEIDANADEAAREEEGAPLIIDDADVAPDSGNDGDEDSSASDDPVASDEDEDAVAPVPAGSAKRAPKSSRRKRASTQDRALGRAVYSKRCASCHGGDGRGKTKLGERFNIPSITRTPGARIARAIRHGVPGTRMRPYTGKLSARELKAVTNFARAL